MDKDFNKSSLLSSGFGPDREFDPVYYFSNPGGTLIDFAIHHSGGYVYRYYSQPCYMNLANGARLTQFEHPRYWNHATHTYGPVETTEAGKADYLWIALRLPSTTCYGMDYEDDMHRDEMEGVWEEDEYYDHLEEGTPRRKKDGSLDTSDDALAIAWWKYVFSRRYSPWRKALIAPVEYVKNEQGQIIGVKLMVNETIHAQNFVSMCMASRMPWENLGHLRVWGKMREAGFKRYESLYVAAHIRYLRNEKTLGFRTCSGHFSFSPWMTNIPIKWLRDGTPNCYPDELFTRDEYHDVDAIWDDASRSIRDIKDTVLFPILVNTESKYTGSFSKAFESSQEHQGLLSELGTWDVVLSKLKENHDKWKA